MKTSKLATVAAAGALTIACFSGLVACSGNSSAGEVAATVNGTQILESDVTASIEAIRASYGLTDDDSWGSFLAQNSMTPSSIREQMIESYIQQALAEQGAESRGVTVEDSEVDSYVETMKANYSGDDAWESALEEAGFTESSYRERIKESLISQKLQQTFVDEVSDDSLDADTLNTYASMYASYFSGAKKSSHVLFAADDTETAQSVLDQINNGEISFEDAAAQYSLDTASAEDGGNVGWDKLSSFVTEYTTALSELSEGQVSGLVTSTYGIHIIKCTQVFEPADTSSITFEDLPAEFQETISSMLKSTQGQSDYSTWLDEQEEAADITINDMPSDVSYYVDMTKYATDDSDSSDDESDEADESTDSTESTNDAASDAATEGESSSSSN